MIYVIDHNDSFTHNVVHQFSLFDEVICDNYNEIRKSKLEEAKVIATKPRIFDISNIFSVFPDNEAIIAPTIMTDEIAFVTDINGVCKDGVTLHTT